MFFVAGGTIFLSFLLLCPVHWLAKAPLDDIHSTNTQHMNSENAEENIEITDIAKATTEKNVLLPVSNGISGDLESDPLNRV